MRSAFPGCASKEPNKQDELMAVIIDEIAPVRPTRGDFNSGARRALRAIKRDRASIVGGSIVLLGDILQLSKKIQKNCL
jgi:hypothetical protein